MVRNITKRQWQRGFGRRRTEALELGGRADEQIERLLIRRFDRLISVKRFVALWVTLFLFLIFATVVQLRALSPYYQALRPVPGGIYNEGLIGTFSNANPLYANGSANAAISRLVFSGLFKYDDKNQLVGDLAKDYVLGAIQTRYLVHLKPNITWQDGKPFTASDVVFTYRTIQNIATQSSLYSSWKDIKVNKLDDLTVVFDLPNPLGSFPHALTNGILPEHALKHLHPEQLRSDSFNTAPIGTGPFQLKFIEVRGSGTADRQQRISLAAFKNYWAGRPKLDGINIITFSDDQHLIASFKQKQINAMSGLETLPEELAHDSSVHSYSTPLTSAAMAFFKTSQITLSSPEVRKALVASVNRGQLASLFDNPVSLVDEPLLHDQLGYDASVAELPYNVEQANQLLDQAGWKKGPGEWRVKDGKTLELNLSSQNTPQYTEVAQFLQKEWAKVGVKITVNYYSGDDLQSFIIANHDYDILLYSINIGVDPDVFAYWDTTQASLSSQGHLNLSEYKSSAADRDLEAARTRSDPELRVSKYKQFLTEWAKDAPALALYQPNYLYITRGQVFNYQRKADNSSIDHFYNADKWMVRQQRQTI